MLCDTHNHFKKFPKIPGVMLVLSMLTSVPSNYESENDVMCLLGSIYEDKSRIRRRNKTEHYSKILITITLTCILLVNIFSHIVFSKCTIWIIDLSKNSQLITTLKNAHLFSQILGINK